MSDQTKFVELDGKTHVIVEGERTACFLVIPPDGTYTTEVPTELCDECAEKTGVELPKKGKKSGAKT